MRVSAITALNVALSMTDGTGVMKAVIIATIAHNAELTPGAEQVMNRLAIVC